MITAGPATDGTDNKIRLEGEYAALAGKSVDDCPYKNECIARTLWIAGFHGRAVAYLASTG